MAGPMIIGGARGVGGCLGAAGFTFCSSLNRCVRAWEEPCPAGGVPVAAPVRMAGTAFGQRFAPVGGVSAVGGMRFMGGTARTPVNAAYTVGTPVNAAYTVGGRIPIASPYTVGGRVAFNTPYTVGARVPRAGFASAGFFG